MKKLKIGLVYDLREDYQLIDGQPEDFYAEFDSEKTVLSLQNIIESLGHEVTRIGNFHALVQKIYTSSIDIDLFFNIAEGLYGRSREAQVPALLEANELAHTGSDAYTLALTLNKATTKRIWQSHGLPTAPFVTVNDVADLEHKRNLVPEMPVFSKPLYAGSSIGIDESALSKNFHELSSRISKLTHAYRQPILVEQFLPSNEYTVCVLGSDDEAHVFGMTQILSYQENKFSVFQEKEAWNSDFFAAVEDDRLYKNLEQLAIQAYTSVGCRDIGRVDIRFDNEGTANLIEVNPLPILKEPSTIAWIAQKNQKSISFVVDEVIQSASKRIIHKQNP